MTALLNSGLLLPIPLSVQQQAQQFAARQLTPHQGVQVYLNTLAVWTVHRYLALMQIPTMLEQSESWQPGTQSLLGSADVWVPGWGRLECLALRPGQQQMMLPPEALVAQRFGLVGVEVGDRLDQATLLGFLPATPTLPTTVQRRALGSLDGLLTVLSTPPVTRLNNWLWQEFEQTWQAVSELLRSPTPAFALRSTPTRQRAKQLPWAILTLQLQALEPETEQPKTYQLDFQLHPLPSQAQLPTDLRLRVLTDQGEVFRELRVRSQDTLLQYTIQAQSQEQFTIEVALGDQKYQERFEM
ncbi:MAG: DUF1822 family protein [Cyanobacteria bacterium P01_G01_bin.54]